MNDTQLATRKSAAELVNAWTTANEIMIRAERELDEAMKILETAFGPNAYMNPHPTHHLYNWEAVHKANLKQAWTRIIDKLGIRKTMSLKRMAEMDKNIEDGKMPALTLETIRSISEALIENAPTFATEAIHEVFDYLRPGAGGSKYKTNQTHARFALGKKVIIVRALEFTWSGTFKVSHWQSDKISATDRIFHLADGKAAGIFNSYNSPLIDAIATCKDGQGETDYFTFKCHQNGNLHLTFKRPDLVTKLNYASGGDNRLADR
jgi:hypothetical protein